MATWPAQDRSGLSPALFWQAVVVLGFNLGLRREDLFGLTHDAVDFRAGNITLVIGKTRRPHRLPMNDAVRAML